MLCPDGCQCRCPSLLSLSTPYVLKINYTLHYFSPKYAASSEERHDSLYRRLAFHHMSPQNFHHLFLAGQRNVQALRNMLALEDTLTWLLRSIAQQ